MQLISESSCTYMRTAVDAQTALTAAAAAVGQSAFRSSWDVGSVYFPTMFSEVPNTSGGFVRCKVTQVAFSKTGEAS